MAFTDHVRVITAAPLAAIRCSWLYSHEYRATEEKVYHAFALPDGTVAWTTSPEWLGIGWEDGILPSLDALVEMARARHGGRLDAAVEVCPPEYGPARVELWSEQAREAFALGMARAGGFGILAERVYGAPPERGHAAPGRTPAAESAWADAAPTSWALKSLLARRAEVAVA